MSGPGDNPFGSGPFGRYDWSKYQLIDLLPEIYRQQDADFGGKLVLLQESIQPLFDYAIDKIANYDDMRDPLRCPVETATNIPVRILAVTDLQDGTSRVFLSQGADGLDLEGLRPGQILVDSSDTRFQVLQINVSDLAIDYDDPPSDPFTGNDTGKNIIVSNIASGNREIVPLVSGETLDNEDVTPSPLDNGSNVGPYVFTVSFSPLASNVVTVQWRESGTAKYGFFISDGQYFGQLGIGSSINFTSGTVTVVPGNGVAIDSDSLRMTYTTRRVYQEDPTPTPLDDGATAGPYSVTAVYTPLQAFQVRVDWQEGVTAKVGFFSSGGAPSGDLHAASTINFTSGVMSIRTASAAVIAADSLRITYLSATVVPPDDALVSGQNILSFLGSDYGVDIDRRDPEIYQRSFVYHAHELWSKKGTVDGYAMMGRLAGYHVKATNLYRISSENTASIPSGHLFTEAGYPELSENPGYYLGTSISPLEDPGVTGAYTIQVLRYPLYDDADIVIDWIEASTGKTITVSPADAVSGQDSADISSLTVNRTTGVIVIDFVASKYADYDSIRVSYTPVQYYTDLAPKRPFFDDIIADVIPTDMFCFDDDFPSTTQTVNITSVVNEAVVGTEYRWAVVATTSASYLSFGTEGILTDSVSGVFSIENFARLSATTYSFNIISAASPATGAGTMAWSVLRNSSITVTDDPDTSYGSTISPDDDGAQVGPFTIQLSTYPLDSSVITLTWTKAAASRTATVSGTSTVGGTNAANISAASINRTTGVLTLTYVGGQAPDANSVRVNYGTLADMNIVGVGTDTTVLGTQFYGHTGIRYRLRKTFATEIIIATVGNWKLIDTDGVSSWIEKMTLVSSAPYVYDFEFVSATPPATGPANMFYMCELVPDCLYCPASAVRMSIRAGDVVNYPQALTEGSTDRLISRLDKMLPAHVRFSQFDVYEEVSTAGVGAAASVASASAISTP